MNLFERIDRMLLVENAQSDADYIQPWSATIDGSEIERDEEELECFDFASKIVWGYVNAEGIMFNPNTLSQRAFYNKDEDRVVCPCRKQFSNDADFFCTIFHELVHSTGAENRLKRDAIVNLTADELAEDKYNREELIAELGAMYLCGICCYNDGKVFEQSANYIRCYRQMTGATDEDLKETARQALKAVDYILGENEE